jgi:hypothetical protein
MAGIAPLSGSVTTTSGAGISGAPQTRATTPAAVQTQPSDGSADFTAFPSSYAGFGANGAGFGTLSVVNGTLSVISAPAVGDATAATGTAIAAHTIDSRGASTLGDNDAADGLPPVPPFPPVPQQSAQTIDVKAAASTPATATPALTETTGNAPSNTSADSTTGALPGTASPAAPTSTGIPSTTSGAPLQPVGQAQSNPTAGLLGSPATNPIVIQAQAQELAAAAAAQAESQEAAADQAADQVQLELIDARIAAARAAGNAAAVAQLQPAQNAVIGQLQGQTFVGLGESTSKPFARPEIPTVFLNIAS